MELATSLEFQIWEKPSQKEIQLIGLIFCKKLQKLIKVQFQLIT